MRIMTKPASSKTVSPINSINFSLQPAIHAFINWEVQCIQAETTTYVPVLWMVRLVL